MKLSKKVFTLRRGLALLLVVSMVVSLIQITTIGFADEHGGSSAVSVGQQLGATEVVSADPGLIKANDSVRYTITAPVILVEEPPVTADENGAEAASEGLIAFSDDSLFMPVAGDMEDATDNQSESTTPLAQEDEKDGGLPGTADTLDDATDKATAVITADLPEKFILSKDQLEIKVQDADGNNVAVNPVDQSTDTELKFTIPDIDRNCTVLVDIFGNAASDLTAGDVLVFQASLQVNSEAPQQSNIVRATAPLPHTMTGKVIVIGTPAHTIKANEFSFNVVKSKDGANSETTTVSNDSSGNFTLFSANYTEAGTYTYNISQKDITTSGAVVITKDAAQYIITVPVTATVAGNLEMGTITITKDGKPHAGDIVFTNNSSPATLTSAKVQLSGVVSTVATLKGGEFTFTITPVRVDYSGVPKMASEESTLFMSEDVEDNQEEPSEDLSYEVLTDEELEGLNEEDTQQDEEPFLSKDISDEVEGISEESSLRTEQVDDTEKPSQDISTEEPSEEENTVKETGSSEEQEENSDTEKESVESSDPEEETADENTTEKEATEDDDGSEEVEVDPNEEEPIPNAQGSLTVPPSPAKLTTTNNADGTFSFGEVTFTEPATYIYEVRQTGSTQGIDSSVFQINVKVEAGSTALSPSITYTKNGVPASSINFVNAGTPSVENKAKVTMTSYQAVQGGNNTQEQLNVAGNTTITYTMDIVNEGTEPANGVIITAPIPSGLTYISNSQTSGGEYRNNAITWYANRSIAAGQRVSVSFKVTVPQSTAINRWTFSPYLTYTNNPNNTNGNLAQVAGGSLVAISSGNGNNSDNGNTGLRLTLTQQKNRDSAGTANITAYEGDTIRYSVNVTNTNANAVDNISITDYVPDGLSVITNSISSNGTLRSGNVLWSINRLESGATVTLSFDAEVDELRSSTTISNSVQAYAQANTSNISRSNSVSATLYPETELDDFSIDIEQSLTTARNATDKEIAVKSGDTVTYYISVSNLGRSSSGELTVVCDIPDGMSVVSRSVSDDGYVSRKTVTWELDSIAGRSSEELSFSVTVPNSGTYWDCFAELEFDDSSDKTLKSNTVRSSTNGSTTNNGVSLVLSQAVNGGSSQNTTVNAGQGDTITYTLVLTNTSKSQLTNVVITDVIPSGLTFVQNSANGGGVMTGNTVTWSLGTMPVNSRYTVSFNATVNQSTIGTTWSNSGTATYRSGNNSDSVQSNTLAINYSGMGSNPNNTGTNQPNGSGGNTGSMGDSLLGGSSGNTNGSGTTNTNDPNYDPDRDPNNYPEVFDKDKIPQTGGFTEIHLWIFLFVVSGLGLLLMGVTSKKQKYVW